MKEPDRRGPRAKGPRGHAAIAEEAQEGRDKRRMRPQRLESQALGVGGELPPACFVAAPGILGGSAGDQFTGGGDGARDVRGGGGRNVDHAGGHSGRPKAVPVVLINPVRLRSESYCGE